MARTVNEITTNMLESLQTKLSLSQSKVAEWKLWIHIVAIAIHTFELILDQFKSETEQKILETRPGTEKWYEHICYNFQDGFELFYDEETGTMGYKEYNEESRITAVAAVQEVETRTINPENIIEIDRLIILRVAKNEEGKLAPFTPREKLNFENYINKMKFAGSKTSIISTTADQILYEVTIYYNPTHPYDLIEARTEAALENFNLNQQFGGIIYKARFLEAIMGIDGIVTAKLHKFQCKGTSDEDYKDVDISLRLEAGYFNYDPERCKIDFQPSHKLTNDYETA